MDTPGGFAWRAAFIWLRLRLYLDDSPSPGMAYAYPSAPRPSSYHAEVWTDAPGYATVRPPARAGALEPTFTIGTDRRHVKVAWRVTGQPPHRQQKEEGR